MNNVNNWQPAVQVDAYFFASCQPLASLLGPKTDGGPSARPLLIKLFPPACLLRCEPATCAHLGAMNLESHRPDETFTDVGLPQAREVASDSKNILCIRKTEKEENSGVNVILRRPIMSGVR